MKNFLNQFPISIKLSIYILFFNQHLKKKYSLGASVFQVRFVSQNGVPQKGEVSPSVDIFTSIQSILTFIQRFMRIESIYCAIWYCKKIHGSQVLSLMEYKDISGDIYIKNGRMDISSYRVPSLPKTRLTTFIKRSSRNQIIRRILSKKE